MASNVAIVPNVRTTDVVGGTRTKKKPHPPDEHEQIFNEHRWVIPKQLRILHYKKPFNHFLALEV